MTSQTNFILDRAYSYKVLSVDHLSELQEDIDKLRRGGKLSDHEIYRSYIDDKKFELPESLPNARSLIVIAIFDMPMLVNFHLNGKIHEVILPHGYYATGLSKEMLEDTILTEIIKKPGYKVEMATQVHVKLLAVRSGLGCYGRNNLCYVDGMGSLIKLFAFYTDYQFPEDHWTEIRMMKHCQDCRICMKQCPNGCISDENFVIDAGKCLSLYNEIEGTFPEWINPMAHNALMGCMRCQAPCPANREGLIAAGRLDDVNEEETTKILNGTPDDELLKSLTTKLRQFYPASSKEYFPIFTRNLEVLVKGK